MYTYTYMYIYITLKHSRWPLEPHEDKGVRWNRSL